TVYMTSGKVIQDENTKKNIQVMGVDIKRYLEFDNKYIIGDKDKIEEKFFQGRYALVDTKLRNLMKLKENDKVKFEFNNRVITYTIAGFFNVADATFNVYIPEKFVQMDARSTSGYWTMVKVKDKSKVQEVKKAISDKFKEGAFVETVEGAKKINETSGQGIAMVLQGFVVFSVVIGVFGIFNNFLISFMTRKKVLGMLRSIGMSKGQMIKMLIAETVSVAVFGSIVGCVAAVLMITTLDILSTAASVILPISYAQEVFVQTIVWSVVISLLASISSMIKAFKL
ncbi:MAG: FtsX-like permease family protein, partial [candidate division WOR-3 bacterium]|nr:FtsX-like permease family protein [candidate division WOR-3 bacterium]